MNWRPLASNAATPHKNLAALGYLLLFLGCLFGVTALIGAIINHTHLQKTTDTVLRSHLLLQLITFWTLVVVTACTIVFATDINAAGFAIFGVSLWLISLICGTAFLLTRRAVPFMAK